MGANCFFNLDYDKCKLVKGYSGAALYDLAGGKVLSVPPELIKLMHPYADSFIVSPASHTETHPFIKMLLGRGLGSFEASPPLEHVAREQFNQPPAPDFCWLEITSDCNLHCVHCYGSFGPPEYEPASLLTLAEWKKIIREIKDLGFSRIQFIGGEPLLCEFLPELLFETGSLGFSFIEIFSNLVFLEEMFLNALGANNGSLATTIYSVQPSVHDRVTGHPGSFEATINGLRRAVSWGISVRVGCIVTAVNEGQVGDVRRLVEENGGNFGGYDQARPSGRGNKTTCQSTIPRQTISQPFYTNSSKYVEAQMFNPCWQGKMTVTAKGDILPCVFSRECIAGNVRLNSLQDIMNNGLKKYWGFTKDQVETCRDCEFRYACSDCRPLAAGWNQGNINAKTYGCGYDPYSGIWK